MQASRNYRVRRYDVTAGWSAGGMDKVPVGRAPMPWLHSPGVAQELGLSSGFNPATAVVVGCPVSEEFPIFLVIFSIPAAVGLLIWWKS
jgi:hypothetical protein